MEERKKREEFCDGVRVLWNEGRTTAFIRRDEIISSEIINTLFRQQGARVIYIYLQEEDIVSL